MKLCALLISFTTDVTMVALLWFYLIYFFKKKKLILSKERRQFSGKEKCVITYLFIILVSNSVNVVVDNTIDIAFHMAVDRGWTDAEMIWKLFNKFWFDLLILNNGLIILMLYRHMALLSKKQDEFDA